MQQSKTLGGLSKAAESYLVRTVSHPINGTVRVPGSKSITNRVLLMAALSKETSVLHGVLFSDDSRHFLQCLRDLGYSLTIEEEKYQVTIKGQGLDIPKKSATIHVGSAGTAARFLTSMLALSDGTYDILCSSQMEKRPMKPLFDALRVAGASFTFLKEENHLPVRVVGNGRKCKNVSIDISKSTQFLSALLMVAPMTEHGMKITVTSEKKTGAYVDITRTMLHEFHIHTDYTDGIYTVLGGQYPVVGEYTIEPDVSAACYFYAAAAITGGVIKVKDVTSNLMQGDMQFLSLLERMGCSLSYDQDGITLTGPALGEYNGITADLNNYSDQALTLAAVAAYAKTSTTIKNIAHIRGQECDRMVAIKRELEKVGCRVDMTSDSLTIHPGPLHGAFIETYEDHRVAMAFSLLGLRTEGINILNPSCCSKTFERYFEVLDQLIDKN